MVHTHTWHRDSHGLFDYESKNVTQNYIKCNYSSNSSTHPHYRLVILRRFENDIIFEELGHWNGMEAMANYVIGNMMAVIFEKYGTFAPN